METQVEAYNARDIEAFVACYADEIGFEDENGRLRTAGRDDLRKRYGELFASGPNLHAEISSRIRIGPYVVDEERVTGLPGGNVHAVAIYRLDSDGLIDRVRLLR